ncbi:MAG: quinone oxidoreductase [Comamonas sp.]|jgi:NADPH2:quinone reductase|uniref:Quinone oxidoreductase n=2 Tax=Comamonas TaxID=283 RepID=A0ABR8SBK6_9BURK|nr:MULTISPECIES: quinone oxidoreductase [Comamonas]MBD7960825.1 quinone oxidoreductase [Comamonas avium]MBD9401407.1 quinone oxidoreductase [Comamonas sp. CMM02]
MVTTTSKCVQISRNGGTEVLELVTRDVGQPGAGEILLRHHAVGLNFIDVYQRSGLYALPLPLQLGMEGAGVVEAVGDGVTHLQTGDRVAYASNPPGSYCERRVMPATHVCKLPDSISFDTGAAMMLKGLTVQYLLKQCLPAEGLQAGDFVLFHAAAGGVGLIACQWAKALGLQLIATAGSDEKCQLALANGASHAINYRTEDFAAKVKAITGGQGVKVVYDSVGKDTWEGSIASLRRFGLMVSFGNASGPVPPLSLAALAPKGLYVTRPSVFVYAHSRSATQAMADDLFNVVSSGKVNIHIAQRYALEQVRTAHEALEARQTTGSTILTV